jgi:hypothetical protein
MSQLSDEQVKETKEIFTEAYYLYVEGKYQESLEKYQQVLFRVEPTDDIAAKVTVYTAIAQVHSKLGESEIAKSDEFNIRAIQELQKIKLTDSQKLHQIMSPIRNDLMMSRDGVDVIIGRNPPQTPVSPQR